MPNVQLLSLYAASLHNMDRVCDDATEMLDSSVVQLLYNIGAVQ